MTALPHTADPLERRLAAIRGGGKRVSPSVRVLAAYARHTDCPLATLGFAAGVDFDRLLAGTALASPFGQSPFAINRGLAFERRLRADGHALALQLLRDPLGLPADAKAVDLRGGFPAGPARMPARAAATADRLRAALAGDPAAPRLLDGAVLPAAVGGLPAHFEADLLAAPPAAPLRVGEVKSFPRVDGRVDADQLGAALDQAAVYVHLARGAVDRLGGKPERVDDRAFVVTPHNVGLTPVVSEVNVAGRVRRVERVLAAVPAAADVAAAAPPGLTFAPVADRHADERSRLDALDAVADQIGTAYSPGCLGTCGNARFCRARAVAAQSPCALGPAAGRLLPGVLTLGRAAALTRGAAPAPAEAPAAELLARAGRLIDAALPPPPGSPS